MAGGRTWPGARTRGTCATCPWADEETTQALARHAIALARDRATARFRAKTRRRCGPVRSLTLDLAAWLETGHWTNPQDDLVRDRGDLAIAVYAAEQLTRRWRKVRKSDRTLAELDASSRHKLRIQTKKLRYAAEFFASLFQNKRAVKRRKQLLSALGRLQDG